MIERVNVDLMCCFDFELPWADIEGYKDYTWI